MAGLTPQDAKPCLEFPGPEDPGNTTGKDIIGSHPGSDHDEGNGPEVEHRSHLASVKWDLDMVYIGHKGYNHRVTLSPISLSNIFSWEISSSVPVQQYIQSYDFLILFS